MISVVTGRRATTSRLVLVMAVLLALIGCTSDAEPALPSSTDAAAIAERVTGPDGQAFLRDITAASWNACGTLPTCAMCPVWGQ